MRIVLLTEPKRSSDFVVRDIFFAGGIEHDVTEAQPLTLTRALQADTPELLIIEAFRDADFTERLLEQAKNQAPDTPVFILYHEEAAPYSQEERRTLGRRFKELGAADFADTALDADYNQVASRLLKATGHEPVYTLAIPSKSNITIGELRFNVLERKAYRISKTRPNTEKDEGPVALKDTWQSIGHLGQQALFGLRGANQRIKPTFGPQPNETFAFDLSEDETSFVNALALRQGSYIGRQEILRYMHASPRFLPEAFSVDDAASTLQNKLWQYVDDSHLYILYNDAKGYMLNERTLEAQPEPDALPEEDIPEEDIPDGSEDPEALFSEMFEEAIAQGPVGYSVYPPGRTHLRFSDTLTVNTTRNVMFVPGRSRDLSVEINDQERAVLEALAPPLNNPIMSLNDLCDSIYSGEIKPNTRHVRTIISGLNEKFKSLGFNNDLIVSVAGQGFKINAPDLGKDHDPGPHQG